MVDAALEMAASELSDKQQLRRALDQLVISCEHYHPDSPGLVAALVFARGALEDTSHEGWLRRMRERRQAVLTERYAECRQAGQHIEVEYTYNEHPRCIHCEQFLKNTPTGL